MPLDSVDRNIASHPLVSLIDRPFLKKTRDDVLGRIGSLETRLAKTSTEVDAALSVRYRVFVEEMKAKVSSDSHLSGLESDSFDTICDHLLVLDTSIVGDTEDQIVGTYRLLRQDVARQHSGFYSASEFQIGELLQRHPEKRFMELGRSCVLPPYRTKRTVELLWQGNWAYALNNNVDAMFGCGSFSGTIPAEHAMALSFLHENALATGQWAVSANQDVYRTLDLMPSEAIDARRALVGMPPLIKGYLRLGAMIGDGCVVDHAFNTTDVLVILPISNISGRYLNYYGADAGRFAS